MKPVRIRLRHITKFGVSYRYRSGTTAFTEQGAGHYTKDTIRKHSAALESRTALLFLAPLDMLETSQVQCCSSVAVTECFLMVRPEGTAPS